ATNQGLVVGQTSFELTKAAQQLEIPVQANVKFSVEVAANCKDWITYKTTKGLTSSTVVLDIAENKTYDSREGKVTIKQDGGSLSSTIDIKQTQLDGLFITTPEYDLSNESHTLTVEVSTNVEFEVTSGSDWVKYVETKGLHAKQIILSVAANETYNARETQVSVKQKNGSLSGTVTIRQDEKYGLMVTQSTYDLSSDAQTFEVEVRFNVNYDIVIPAACKDWLKLVSTKGLSEKTCTFSVGANQTFDPREGSITFKQKNGPLSGTVAVKQAQNDALFVDQTVFDVSGDGGTVTVDFSTNVNCVVETESNWIHVIETKGLQAHQAVLEIDANDSREPREGAVYVRQAGGKIGQNIRIRQGGSVFLQERDALIAFYKLMNGPNWSRSDNWCSDKPVTEWYGIGSTCYWVDDNRYDGHVRTIFLPGIGVSGDLEEAVGILENLPYLEDLSLQGNPLKQPIPASITRLKTLRMIEFWDCQLTGTIPTDIGNLEKLEYLEIGENPELTGPIPASLGNLSEAKWINVSYCNLTGNIPVEITKLNKLDYPFDCWDNAKMTGAVPAEFAQWKYWNDWWGHIVVGTGLSLDKATPTIPNFSVTLTDGQTVTADVVKDHKLTVLFQWATWCVFSAQFLPLMRSAYKEFAKEGLYVLSWADKDEPAEKVLKHMSENGIIWPTFIADEKTNKIVGDLLPKSDRNAFYPYASFPSINAFDSDGKLVYTNANSNQMETFVPFMQKWFGSDWDGGDETNYESTDYSLDGRVTTMQLCEAGKGIDLVITGDAFSDRLIADGTFRTEVDRTIEAFFSVEPYKSMRQFFNIFAVNAVSKTEIVGAETAFSTTWTGGNPTVLGGDNAKILDYARTVIGDARMDDAVIICLMNLDMNAGTCHLFDAPAGDYGRGVTVSYVPTHSQDRRFKEVTVHEAGGHGFAKLADEYTMSKGNIPQDEIDYYRARFASGWWKNIDFTSDPAAVKWAPFIGDERYAAEEIGVYQGGATYDWGVYRPTFHSVMTGGDAWFNAPSRYAIWYRVMKLSQGAQWNGTYEDFVAWDLAHPADPKPTAPRPNYVEKQSEPLAQPVIHNRSWRELVKQPK
ncbi:MAG: redoxin domain-containing protein, partial [Bacteroidales bacterium]|nr:redoxin domain-containing protein [Bacteroidales bacterium]